MIYLVHSGHECFQYSKAELATDLWAGLVKYLYPKGYRVWLEVINEEAKK